jgi:ubiquinone/menaquinone biosynthesis C-methylase UbiE
MNVFETEADRYDEWFENHPIAYQSELAAIRELLPKTGRGVEIGTGTGRFSIPLGISEGVEPAQAMRKIAQIRGLNIQNAQAENLPFSDNLFDFALMITTLCFVEKPLRAFQEAVRILKPTGKLLVGLVDLDSNLGKEYECRKANSPFYRHARFFSASETIQLLDQAGFCNFRCRQTLFQPPERLTDQEVPQKGFGEGGFVVISGERP